MHWPGIEPGPPAWQARILPLNHQCVHVRGGSGKEIRACENCVFFCFSSVFIPYLAICFALSEHTCVCVCVCVCARAHAGVRNRVCACGCADALCTCARACVRFFTPVLPFSSSCQLINAKNKMSQCRNSSTSSLSVNKRLLLTSAFSIQNLTRWRTPSELRSTNTCISLSPFRCTTCITKYLGHPVRMP